MIPEIDEKLNYLSVLAEEKSVTHAAKRLYISQPALTAYINRLENRLGMQLFDRSTSPIQITPAGIYYLSEMEKIQNQYNRLHSELINMERHLDMRLSISIGRNRGAIWIPQILPLVYRRFPNADIRISEERDEDISEKVVHNMVDIAIGEAYFQNQVLEYQLLQEEPHVLVTSRNNKGFQIKADEGLDGLHPVDISPSAFNAQTFICAATKNGINHYAKQLLSTYNLQPQRIIHISNSITAYKLALSIKGIAYLAVNQIVDVGNGTRPLFLMIDGKPVMRKIYVIYKKDNMSPLKKHFISVVKRILSA